MLRDCKIRIISGTADDEDFVEFLSSGVYGREDGVTTIEYIENDGLKAAAARIVISDDTVTLSREGDNAAIMVFQKGKSYSGVLNTPYGRMPISIYSHRVAYETDDESANLDMMFSVDLNGERSVNTFKLTAEIN